ncbi:MAG: hypothetical protein AAGM38_07220 [Pseudomonadota bacterium]
MNRFGCGAAGLGAGLVLGWVTQPPLQPIEPLHRAQERAMHILFFGVLGMTAGVAIGLMMERRAARRSAAFRV